MAQALPTRALIERLRARLASDGRKTQCGGLDSSISLPLPGALSGPLVGATFLGGVAGAMSLSDSPYPRPGAHPADIRRYFRGNRGAARVSVVGQLLSAASLARFSASVAKLAARSGGGSRGLRAAAVGGGGIAAASLATSALCAAALSGSRGERDDSAAALHRLMFAAGDRFTAPASGPWSAPWGWPDCAPASCPGPWR